MTIDLRLGRWQDALSDVEMVDAVITDPPYSERTHAGHDAGMRSGDAAAKDRRYSGAAHGRGWKRSTIDYQSWTADDVARFVGHWAPRTRGWFVVMTDHALARDWEDALESTGRYVFSPLQFIAPGSRVRLAGDGPSQWSVSIVVSRPSKSPYSKWGTLPGGYVLPPGENDRSNERGVTGGKPLWIMRSLVRDYTRHGDLVCDPCAGGATTLLAAAMEGRRAIGSEMDPKTYALAQKRIAKGYTPPLFVDAPRESANDQQLDLLGKAE